MALPSFLLQILSPVGGIGLLALPSILLSIVLGVTLCVVLSSCDTVPVIKVENTSPLNWEVYFSPNKRQLVHKKEVASP
jgi:hypothetical protein